MGGKGKGDVYAYPSIRSIRGAAGVGTQRVHTVQHRRKLLLGRYTYARVLASPHLFVAKQHFFHTGSMLSDL
jgi:hypothetical protein